MSFYSHISKLLNKKNPVDDLKSLETSWDFLNEEFKYLSGTASGSIFVDPVELVKTNLETDSDSSFTILAKNYKKLEDRVKIVEERQRVSESTQTEWILDNKSKIEFLENQLIINEKVRLRQNLSALIEIGNLEENWNQYGAKRFNQNLIYKCMNIITETELKYQPEIFPTGRQSIQFEYEPDENHYLEIEIFDSKIKLYKRINSKSISEDDINLQTAINQINEFQSKF
jgi:hypothetical protein